MATKSILKQITIKDKKSCEMLANALDHAANKTGKTVDAPKTIVADSEDVKKNNAVLKLYETMKDSIVEL